MLGFKGDIDRFGKFLTSLWGLLAGASVLFPILNNYVTVIPIPNPQARLATTLALLATVFALVYSFVERHLRLGNLALRAAFARFVLGVILLAVHLVLIPAYSEFAAIAGNNIMRIGLSVLNSINVVVYASLFALITSALAALAVMEYTKAETEIGTVEHYQRLNDRLTTVQEPPTEVFQKQA